MDKDFIVEKTKAFVKDKLFGEGSGHDWYHIERVYNLSKAIHEKEGGDLFIIKMSALLHDIGDWKFSNRNETETDEIEGLLSDLGVDSYDTERILKIIKTISYKGGVVDSTQKTIEGMIVQDADRLDALGAIGIARTFTYSGYKNSPIYDPNIDVKSFNSLEEVKDSKGTAINHFYEKLLKLKDLLNTEEGRRIGKKRHEFMEEFLEEFFQEWNLGK